MNKATYVKLLNEINTRIKEGSEAIASGSCEDLKDYGFKCGRVQGLKDSVDLFDEIFSKYIKAQGDTDWSN